MKTTVIVGGSSGIGLALAQKLKNERVINISRTQCAVADVVNLKADVTDRKALAAAFDCITEMDRLVYCAGCSLAAPVEFVRPDDCEYLFAVDVIGAIDCVRLALPKLDRSDDGRVLLLSSAAGVAPIPFDAFYDAAKAALIQLSYALRLEAPDIKTTAAIIGGVKTQFSFKRKVYDECGDYASRLKKAADSLVKIEQTGYSASFIAQKLYDILTDDDPPPAKAIGLKNKLSLALYRILPWRLKLYAVRKMFL